MDPRMQQSLRIMEQELNKVKASGDFKTQLKILTTLAKYYDQNNDTTKALDNYREAAGVAKKLDKDRMYVSILTSISTIYLNLKRNDDSQKIATEILHLCNKFGFQSEKAAALIQLACFSLENGDYSSGIPMISELSRMFQSNGNVEGEIDVLEIAIHLLKVSKTLEETQKNILWEYENRLSTLYAIKKTSDTIREEITRAALALHQSSSDTTFLTLDKCLTDARKTANSKIIATVLLSIASFDEANFNYKNAFTYMKEASDYYGKVWEYKSQALCFASLGNYLLKLGNKEGAAEYAEKALNLCEDTDIIPDKYTQELCEQVLQKTRAHPPPHGNPPDDFVNTGRTDGSGIGNRTGGEAYENRTNNPSQGGMDKKDKYGKPDKPNIPNKSDKPNLKNFTIPQIKQGIKDAQQAHDERAEFAILKLLGEKYEQEKDYKNALHTYENLIKRLERKGFLHLKVVIMSHIGGTYLAMQKDLDAMRICHQALNLCPQNGYGKERLLIWLQIASIYSSRKDYDNAISVYNEALNTVRATGDYGKEISIISLIIKLHRLRGGSDDETTPYDQRMEELERIIPQLELILDDMKVARQHFDREETREGFQILDSCLKSAEKWGDTHLIGAIHSAFAAIYKEIENYSKSLEALNKAIAMYEIIGDQDEIVFILVQKGLLCLNLGDREGAINCIKNAQALSDEHGIIMNAELKQICSNVMRGAIQGRY